jgi:hypothetical protein
MKVGDVVRPRPDNPDRSLTHGRGRRRQYYVPKSLVDKMKEISAAFEGYKQPKIQEPREGELFHHTFDNRRS